MTSPLPSQKTVKPVNPLNKTAFNARLAITVSIIAIVFSSMGFLFGAMNYYSLQNRTQDIHTVLQNNLNIQSIMTTLTHDVNQQSKHLLKLQNQLHQLENNQNISLQKTIAEINYFVHLANLHLTVGRDKDTALQLLIMAKQHLEPMKNLTLLPLKKALDLDIHQLQTLKIANINQIFIKLNEVSDAVSQLTTLPTHENTPIQDTVSKIKDAADISTHWYNKVWNSLKELKHLFIIHEIKDPTAPITEPNKIFYIKQNIQQQLYTAQSALLHANQFIYHSALTTADKWINQYFSMSKEGEALQKTISELLTVNISEPLPNLNNSIDALSKVKIIQTSIQPDDSKKITSITKTTPTPKNNLKNTNQNETTNENINHPKFNPTKSVEI